MGEKRWPALSWALCLWAAACGGAGSDEAPAGSDAREQGGGAGEAGAEGSSNAGEDRSAPTGGDASTPQGGDGGAAGDSAGGAGGGQGGGQGTDPSAGQGGGGQGGGGAGTNAGGQGGNAGTGGTAAAMGCDAWTTDLNDENLYHLWRRGFLLGGGLVQGTLGDYVADPGYAPIHVTRVLMGIELWGGEDFALRMDEALYRSVRDADEVVVSLANSFGTSLPSTFPDRNSDYPLPYWSSPAVLMALPVASEYEEFLGYLPSRARHVVVARVVDQTDNDLTFERSEVLYGDLPETFVASWNHDDGPRPAISDTPYLVTGTRVSQGTYDTFVRVTDLRRDDPGARVEIEAALAAQDEPDHPYALYLADAAEAESLALRQYHSWAFHRSEVVVVAELSGLAMDDPFVVPLGSSWARNRVVQVLKGTAAEGQDFASGAAGLVGDDCGQRMLFGLASFHALESPYLEMFACPDPGTTLPGFRSVSFHYREEKTPDNLALAEEAIASARPLLQLFPNDQAFDADLVDPAIAQGLWSSPMPSTAALRYGMSLVHIDEVIDHGEGFEVAIRTHFARSDNEVPDLEPSPYRLFFPCGDRRLLEPGASYLVPLGARAPADTTRVPELVPDGGVYFVPGLALPVRSDVKAALDAGSL